MKRLSKSLPSSLEHRLSGYALAASAAGVSLLALSKPAEGKIIYTRKIEACPCKISLNNDAIYDFAIGNTSFQAGEFWAIYSVRPLIKGNRVWGASHSSLQSGGTVTWAFALRSGALIHAFSKGNGRVTALYSWECNSTGNGCFSTYFVGHWVHAQHRYLGLRFISGGKVHYGWARLNVDAGVGAELTGYAYETIPGKPIIAGRTKGPDVVTVEPASLGHLAQGASAIPAWRAKRKKALLQGGLM
jgi:hypothetical protein